MKKLLIILFILSLCITFAEAQTKTEVGTTKIFTPTINANAYYLGGYPLYVRTNNVSLSTRLGVDAGYSETETGVRGNVFLGYRAGYTNLAGTYNYFIGASAGYNNISGYSNTAIGSWANSANTTGNHNISIGYYSNYSYTGSYGYAIGENAGYYGTGVRNTYLGNLVASSSGNTATDNTFIGYSSGLSSTTGGNNSFTGSNAGYSNTTGTNNSYYGSNSGYTGSTNSNNSFYGYQTGYNNIGTYNAFYGYRSGYQNSSGNYNVFYGSQTGYSNTSGSNNTFIGNDAGLVNTTGTDNTFTGFSAGKSNAGSYNSFYGSNAGVSNTSGANNSFYGQGSGYLNTTGIRNTFIGTSSGYTNSTATDNVIVGFTAGQSNNASYNTFVGAYSAFSSTSATNNTFIGWRSGYQNTTGGNNTYIGYRAGESNSTGSGNVCIGYYSGEWNTESNKLYITNNTLGSVALDTAGVLVYGDFAKRRFRINGTLVVNGSPITSGPWILTGTKLNYTIPVEEDNSFTVMDYANGTNVIKINSLARTLVFDDAGLNDYKIRIGSNTVTDSTVATWGYAKAHGGGGSSQWTTSGSGIYYNTNDKSVAIGTAAGFPAKLDVAIDGDNFVTSNGTITGRFINNHDAQNAGDTSVALSARVVKVGAVTDQKQIGIYSQVDPSVTQPYAGIFLGGRVGIGKLNPIKTLDVDGSVGATSYYLNGVNLAPKLFYQKSIDSTSNALVNSDTSVNLLTLNISNGKLGRTKSTRFQNALTNPITGNGAGASTYLATYTGTNAIQPNAGLTYDATTLTVGSTATGNNFVVNATEGSELAPALTTGNWTLGTGWQYLTSPDRIDKNIDGTGTVTTTAATFVTAGAKYAVTIVVSAISGSTATWTLGGVMGVTLSSATTYTEQIVASTTGKLIITPVATALRITISSISIKLVTQGTGDATIKGNLYASTIRAVGSTTDFFTLGKNGNLGILGAPSIGGYTVNLTGSFNASAGISGTSLTGTAASAINISSIAAAQTNGFRMYNSAAATNGAREQRPANINLIGNAYSTGASATKLNGAGIGFRPVEGSTTYGRLTFEGYYLDGSASTTEYAGITTNNGYFGLGVTTPMSKIHIDAGNAAASSIQLTAGTTTGQTATDGSKVTIESDATLTINQQEDKPVNITVNGVIVQSSYYKSMADSNGAEAAESIIDLATGKSGMGKIIIGDNQEYAYFRFTTAGVVTLETLVSANVTTTQTDAKLVIKDNGTNVRIVNELGSTLGATVIINYNN